MQKFFSSIMAAAAFAALEVRHGFKEAQAQFTAFVDAQAERLGIKLGGTRSALKRHGKGRRSRMGARRGKYKPRAHARQALRRKGRSRWHKKYAARRAGR